MKFEKALKEVKAGCFIKCPAWQGSVWIEAQYPNENSRNTNPYLMIHSPYGSNPWQPSQNDLFKDDWKCVCLSSAT